MPTASRSAVPDIAVSARAAQSLSLLFFELASHSDEGLSLVGKHPHIVAQWEVTGEEPGHDLSFPLGRVQHQRGDAAGGQRFRPHPARPRRAGSARRHRQALFHRCQLRLRTHRADGDGRRHDRARPHRADFRAGAAGARVRGSRGRLSRAATQQRVAPSARIAHRINAEEFTWDVICCCGCSACPSDSGADLRLRRPALTLVARMSEAISGTGAAPSRMSLRSSGLRNRPRNKKGGHSGRLFVSFR